MIVPVLAARANISHTLFLTAPDYPNDPVTLRSLEFPGPDEQGPKSPGSRGSSLDRSSPPTSDRFRLQAQQLVHLMRPAVPGIRDHNVNRRICSDARSLLQAKGISRELSVAPCASIFAAMGLRFETTRVNGTVAVRVVDESRPVLHP